MNVSLIPPLHVCGEMRREVHVGTHLYLRSDGLLRCQSSIDRIVEVLVSD